MPAPTNPEVFLKVDFDRIAPDDIIRIEEKDELTFIYLCEFISRFLTDGQDGPYLDPDEALRIVRKEISLTKLFQLTYKIFDLVKEAAVNPPTGGDS